MMKDFSMRQWKCSTLNNLIKILNEIGNADRKPGIDQPRSVRTSDTIAIVVFLCLCVPSLVEPENWPSNRPDSPAQWNLIWGMFTIVTFETLSI